MNKKEVWKPVTGRAQGFPYEVSNLGRVRRKETKYILKPTEGPKGYYRVNLRNSPKRYNVTLHILVADAFLDPPSRLHWNKIR